MVEYTGKKVLLKDKDGEVIIPYVDYASAGRNVGDIFYTTRTDTELNGAVECNGGTYSTSDFTGSQSIGNLLSQKKVPYVSLSEYASIVSANGSCRAFGWDGGTSFRVPLLKDVYIEAGTASSAGEFISESLPNIKATWGEQGAGYWNNNLHEATGAVTVSQGKWTGATSHSVGNQNAVWNFNASRSSSTYKNGAKVKPDSVRYRAMVQLAIKSTDEAVITATSALQQISNKAAIDLSNVSSVASSFKEASIGWGMPDYSAGVNIAVPTSSSDAFVAQYDCYMQGISKKAYYGEFKAYINEVGYLIGYGNSTNFYQSNNIYLFLPKGTKVYFTSGYIEASSLYVFPFKGVK